MAPHAVSTATITTTAAAAATTTTAETATVLGAEFAEEFRSERGAAYESPTPTTRTARIGQAFRTGENSFEIRERGVGTPIRRAKGTTQVAQTSGGTISKGGRGIETFSGCAIFGWKRLTNMWQKN